MDIGAITEYVDTAQIVLYVFWIFFALVVFHLAQEGKREGYPLDSGSIEPSKRKSILGLFSPPTPKEFKMPDGSSVMAPDPDRADRRPLNAREVDPGFPGSTIEPTGDPLVAGVGPGSWAERQNIPDTTAEGTPKIVPMRLATGFFIDPSDPDPRDAQACGGFSRLSGGHTAEALEARQPAASPRDDVTVVTSPTM